MRTIRVRQSGFQNQGRSRKNVAGAGTACSCFAPATLVLPRHSARQNSLPIEADIRKTRQTSKSAPHPWGTRNSLRSRVANKPLFGHPCPVPTNNLSVLVQGRFNNSWTYFVHPVSCISPQPKRLSKPGAPRSFASDRRRSRISAAGRRPPAKRWATTPVAIAEA